MKRPRPYALPSWTYEVGTQCGEIYVTVVLDKSGGKPFEIFARFGRNGTCGAAIFDCLTQLASYGLRSGMSTADAIKALGGTRCSQGRYTCFSAVAEVIADVTNKKKRADGETNTSTQKGKA